MALTPEQQEIIDRNKREALKRLEERRKRLENENLSNQNQPVKSNVLTAPILVKRPLESNSFLSESAKQPKTTTESPFPVSDISANNTVMRHIPDSFIKPLPKSNPTAEMKISLGSGIRPAFQLSSCNTVSVTATTSVQTIVRSFIDKVTLNKTDNTYTIPLEKYQFVIDKLAANEKPVPQSCIPKTVLSAFEPNQVNIRNAAINCKYQIESTIGTSLYTALFPFQREGVNMAIARHGRLIIADEMGLGKSIQAIATAVYFRREWPLLILAPASMVASWQEQILRWAPSVSPADIQVIYDGKVQSLDGLITILSYDLAVRLIDMIDARHFRVVIADECHALRNIETKRSKALIPILKKAERAILLSGTPALSRPIELYPQIQAVNPKLFSKRHDYGLRYCDGHQNYFKGWDFRGSSNTTELQVLLENCIMIRRMKDQVMQQLPRKIRHQIFLNIPSNSKNYKMFKMQTNEFLTSELNDSNLDSSVALESMQKTAEFMALWTRTAEIKLPAMIEYVEDLLDANHKMLIFAHHAAIIDGFASSFISKKLKYICIDGRTPPNKRQDLCSSFQNDEEIRIALLSITAASTGLTLTKATTVIFSELFFNPGVLVQAEDRAHRIGQVDSVNVHYLLAKGTTDDHIWPIILKKLNTLESVGLGKNDFKDIISREHHHAQTTLDKFIIKKRHDQGEELVESRIDDDLETDESVFIEEYDINEKDIYDLTLD